jgi:hypothetical protein
MPCRYLRNHPFDDPCSPASVAPSRAWIEMPCMTAARCLAQAVQVIADVEALISTK